MDVMINVQSEQLVIKSEEVNMVEVVCPICNGRGCRANAFGIGDSQCYLCGGKCFITARPYQVA